AAIFFSILDMVLSEFLPDKWYVTGIFTVLFSLIFYSAKVPEIDKRVRLIDSQMNVGGFEKFKNHKAFYEALETSVKGAESEILLTHIRDDPPSSYVGGKNYFTYIEKWANSRPEGVVKRIGAFGNPAMREWACSQ